MGRIKRKSTTKIASFKNLKLDKSMSMQNESSDRKRVTRRMTDESRTMEAV